MLARRRAAEGEYLRGSGQIDSSGCNKVKASSVSTCSCKKA